MTYCRLFPNVILSNVLDPHSEWEGKKKIQLRHVGSNDGSVSIFNTCE